MGAGRAAGLAVAFGAFPTASCTRMGVPSSREVTSRSTDSTVSLSSEALTNSSLHSTVRQPSATTPLAMYEYPAETTRAVVNLLARNVLVRYPDLKVVVPHCGSFLPLAMPRMRSILPAMVKQGYMQPVDWEGNLARLYFDLAGNPTPEVLRALLSVTTPDHLLYGSDYPYLPDAVLRANLQRLHQTLAADQELAGYADRILWKNAERLFVRDAGSGCTRTE